MRTIFEPTNEDRFRFGHARGHCTKGAIALTSGVLVWSAWPRRNPFQTLRHRCASFFVGRGGLENRDGPPARPDDGGDTNCRASGCGQGDWAGGRRRALGRGVYAFSPAFVAKHREEPIELTFWNLQPDDEPAFALLGSNEKMLMSAVLKPLSKTSYVFTFCREGLFDFKCLEHRPEMNGQILVQPAK